jgi:hypothetical protein
MIVGVMTYEGLIAKGYVWTGRGSCRNCGRAILWFRTFNDTHAPFDPGTFDLHFITCSQRTEEETEAAVEAERERAEAERLAEAEQRRTMLPLRPARSIYFDDRPDAEKLREQLPKKKRGAASLGDRGQLDMEFDPLP